MSQTVLRSGDGTRHRRPRASSPRDRQPTERSPRVQSAGCRLNGIFSLSQAGTESEHVMSDALRVTLEIGPKGKKFAAVAPDWPGLERGGKTAEKAVEMLRCYLPRYAGVADLAGMGSEFAALGDVCIVEQYEGSGSTDFWGISFALSGIDQEPMSSGDLERGLRLMRACWSYFDVVRSRVSPEMRRGPRGGGRDRDRIVSHVLAAEQDWGKKVGVRLPHDEVVVDDSGVASFRAAYCAAIRTLHSEGKLARNWPLRYLIRHTAYHTMDHAWEMEDKDMSGVADEEKR